MITDSEEPFVSEMSSDQFSGLWLSGHEHHAEIDSTNNRALELCSEESLATPFLVLADRQSAGRGRGSNRWWSGEGALMFSLIVDAFELGLPEPRWPQVSLAIGAAVCSALEERLQLSGSDDGFVKPFPTVGLKWPNDVWLNHRKVCGILVEVPSQRRGRLVIGVGLNANNSFVDAPAELHHIATSVRDETGRIVPLPTYLATLLRSFQDSLQRLAQCDSRLPEYWSAKSVLTNRRVTLETGQALVTGRCLGIASDGGLRLQLPSGEQRFYGGTVKAFSDPE